MTHDRNRARTLIIVGVVVAATLAGILLVRMRRDRVPPSAITSVVPGRTGPGQSELADPGRGGAGSARIGESIGVRSRVGLPIQKIYVSGADGDWRTIKLDAGQIDRAALERASVVCAPGHRSRPVERDADEIVLDVDAMLVMKAPGLRRCVERVEPWKQWWSEDDPDPHAPPDSACAGFLDDERIGFAVARQLSSKEQVGEGTPFYVKHDYRTDSIIAFRPKDGSTIEWTTDCHERLATAPLVLHVDPGSIAKGASPIVIVRESGSGSMDSAPVEQSFTWGSVQTWTHPLSGSARHTPGPNEFRIEDAPEGVSLNAVAQDARSLAFATATFINDGTPRDLELRPAFVLHGSIAPDEGPPPKHVDVEWIQNVASGAPRVWRTSSDRVALESDGSFTIAGPRWIDCEADSLADIPRHAEVEIKAPGFRPSKRELLVTSVDRLETGAWTLDSEEPDFVVLPSTEGVPAEFGEGDNLLAAFDDGTVQDARIARVVRRDDGRVRVTCFASAQRGSDNQPAKPAAPLGVAAHLAACLRWHELRGFTRVEPGVFRAEPLQDYDIEIASGSGAVSLTMRLEWFGMGSAVTRMSMVKDNFVHQSWHAPSGSLSFHWRCSNAGPEWNSLPLDRSHQQFNLPPCPDTEPR